MSPEERALLEGRAREIRALAIDAIGFLGVGHLGGALSIADLLAVLYHKRLRVDPANPRWPDRDRLVLSKGHAGPALYAALASRGFFPADWLHTLNRGGTRLPSHCDRNLTPGVDMTTGSLGQGLSAACGMALACRMDGRDSRVFAILGDGESDEGQVWEAAMFAAHHRLSGLVAFTDYNKLQIDGPVSEVLDLGDLAAKWEAFGWFAQRVDGHDVAAVDGAIGAALEGAEARGRPAMIVLDTVKAKGAAPYEGSVASHNMNLDYAAARELVARLG